MRPLLVLFLFLCTWLIVGCRDHNEVSPLPQAETLRQRLSSSNLWTQEPLLATNLLEQLLRLDAEQAYAVMIPKFDGWSQGPLTGNRIEPYVSGGKRGEPYSIAGLVAGMSPGEAERLLNFLAKHRYSLNPPQCQSLHLSLLHAYALSPDALKRSVMLVILRSPNWKEATVNLRSSLPGLVESLDPQLRAWEQYNKKPE